MSTRPADAAAMTDATHDDLLLGDWLSWNPSGLLPTRWNVLVPFFAWMFDVVAPERVVEIGTGDGGSFRPLCELAARSRGQCTVLGIDRWTSDALQPGGANAAFDGLREHGALHHPDVASLLRMDPQEAIAQLDDAGVDLVHVVAPAPERAPIDARPIDAVPSDAVPFDSAALVAKVRPGGVIAMTTTGDDDGEAARKLWEPIAARCPSATIALPGVVGVAQVPRDGDAPIVALLHAEATAAAALFRSLGERVEHRHVLGSEPRSPASVRRYITELADAGAAEVRRLEAQHEVARATIERELASVYERLLDKARELEELRDEFDLLLAKLAAASAAREAQAAEHDVARALLAAEITARDAELVAIRNTVSWRLTRPLRLVQSARAVVRGRRPRGDARPG